MKFMHSLIGAFVIDTSHLEPEVIEEKPHRKLEIKISEFFKRIFYLPCNEILSPEIQEDVDQVAEQIVAGQEKGLSALKEWI